MKTVLRITAIQELKKLFPGNEPSSWGKLGKKELAKTYAEYVLEDVTQKVKIN